LALVIALIFGFWLALSIANQFRTTALPINDVLNLIPKWTFFAPNPGQHDYHVVYRDYDGQDQPLSVWCELLVHQRRPISTAFWNPDKRYRKAIIDCCQSIVQDKVENAPLTIPYLLLLNVVMSRFPSAGARSRNYAVIATRRLASTPPELVLLSEMHAF